MNQSMSRGNGGVLVDVDIGNEAADLNCALQ
jgi:hypothetical protein